MIPSAQAYTTKLNELVEMINSGLFEPDIIKQKNPKRGNCHKNKKKDKETVRVIIELSTSDTTCVELESAEKSESESDSEESNGEDSDTSSKTETFQKSQEKKTMPNHTWNVCLHW